MSTAPTYIDSAHGPRPSDPAFVVVWAFTDHRGVSQQCESGPFVSVDEAEPFFSAKVGQGAPSAWIERREVVKYHKTLG